MRLKYSARIKKTHRFLYVPEAARHSGNKHQKRRRFLEQTPTFSDFVIWGQIEQGIVSFPSSPPVRLKSKSGVPVIFRCWERHHGSWRKCLSHRHQIEKKRRNVAIVGGKKMQDRLLGDGGCEVLLCKVLLACKPSVEGCWGCDVWSRDCEHHIH